MTGRGPEAHRAFIERPLDPWDPTILGVESIENLRTKLLYGRKRPKHPVPITVTGTLFPSALLSSGWWEKHSKAVIKNIRWRDPVQEWLFHGFELWGPSWDFTWDFENWSTSKDRPYFIAQLGEGDEANSLPLLIPGDRARRLQDYIDASGRWGGIEAQVTGILGHRRHFKGRIARHALELFGGLLDYCLWLDEDNPSHKLVPQNQDTSMYSGYLWRCVAPEAFVASGKPSLNDVFFVWEHANLASRDAVAYSVDALERKEEFLRRKFGKLVLVQKSCSLVPGVPAWSPQEIYGMLLARGNVEI